MKFVISFAFLASLFVTFATAVIIRDATVQPDTYDGPTRKAQEIQHGTIDGPSGRFEKTRIFAAQPVDLTQPIVLLPESIPVYEELQDEYPVWYVRQLAHNSQMNLQ